MSSEPSEAATVENLAETVVGSLKNSVDYSNGGWKPEMGESFRELGGEQAEVDGGSIGHKAMEKGGIFLENSRTSVDEVVGGGSCSERKPEMDAAAHGFRVDSAEGVGDLNNGANVMEKETSCQEESQSGKNDHGRLMEAVVGGAGEEAGDSGSSGSERGMDAKKVQIDIGSAKAAGDETPEKSKGGSLEDVSDTGGGKVESVEISNEDKIRNQSVKDLNLGDPVVESTPHVLGRMVAVGDEFRADGNEDRDNEASSLQIPFQDTNQIKLREEGNTMLDSVSSEHVIGDQADQISENANPSRLVLEIKPQLMGRDAESGDVSMISDNRDGDQEDTASKMPVVDINLNIQDIPIKKDMQNKVIAVSDAVPIDDTVNSQAGQFEGDQNLANSVQEVEAQVVGGETEAGDVSRVDDDQDKDQEACQSIQEEDPIVERKPQLMGGKPEVGDVSMMDDKDATASQMPLVDTNSNIQEEDHFTKELDLADVVFEGRPQIMDADSEMCDASVVDGVHDTDQGEDQFTKEPDMAKLAVEVQPRVTHGDTEMDDEFMIDDDHRRDQKASISCMFLVDMDPDIQKDDQPTRARNLPYLEEQPQVLNRNTMMNDEPVEDGGHDRDQEASELGANQNIQEDQLSKDPLLIDPVPGIHPQVMNGEMGICADDMVDHKHDMHQETPVHRMVDTNCGFQGQADTSFGSVLVTDSIVHHDIHVTKDHPSLGNLIPEVQAPIMGGERQVADGSVTDGDHCRVHKASELDINQNVQEEGDMDLVPVDGSISYQARHAKEDTLCCKEIESVQKVGPEEEIPASGDSSDNIMDEGTDSEQNLQVGEQELLTRPENEDGEFGATCTGSQAMENGHRASYCLPSQDRVNFAISDLVWGKVKSHPWWPGQIVDPSDASDLALKHQKKDNFLVAYFGDKTFAWRKESQLKPFHAYFSQMEKQSSLDAFKDAVNDVLVEVYRRVELGMICSCVPEEAYADSKYQKVENAGIREGIITPVLDRSQIVSHFGPNRLLKYIEALAEFPTGGADRLELVIAQAQLKAFYQRKGYPELPSFTLCRGLMEDATESSTLSSEKSNDDHLTTPPSDLRSGKGKSRSGDSNSSFNKEKRVSHGDRKLKSLSELMEVDDEPYLADCGKVESGLKGSEIIVTGSKRKVADYDSADSGNSKKKKLDYLGNIETKSQSPLLNSSFKIGECIRRVASQLTGAPPILKGQSETSQKDVGKADDGADDIFGVDVLPSTLLGTPKLKLDISESEKYLPPHEMLSQLCVAASNPLEGCSSLSMIVSFFTCFRDLRVSSSAEDTKPVEVIKRKRGRPRKVDSLLVHPNEMKNAEKTTPYSNEKENAEKTPRKRGRPRKVDSQTASSIDMKHVEKPKGKRGRKKKVDSQPDDSNLSLTNHMDDAYWSDMILHNNPKNKLTNGLERRDEIRTRGRRKRKKSAEELSISSCPMLDTARNLQGSTGPSVKRAFATERPIIAVEEKIVDECMPTALILSFNHSNSIPSETDLIRIFSRYGPLKEAETDVSKKANRAKVVFKRRADAEVAFSSAGKFSIFGAGLLSYRLRYLSSGSSPDTTSPGKHDAAPIEDGMVDISSFDTAPQVKHEPTAVVGVNLEISAPDVTSQGRQDAEFTEGGNLEVSSVDTTCAMPIAGSCMEVVAQETTPQANHDISLTAGENQEFSSPGTTSEGNHDGVSGRGGAMVASPDTIRGKDDATHVKDVCIEGSSPGITAQGKQDPASSDDGKQEVSMLDAAPHGKHETPSIEGDSIEVAMLEPVSGSFMEVSAPDGTPQGKHDAAPIIGGNLEVSSLGTPSQGIHDAVSIDGGNTEILPIDTAQGEDDTTSTEAGSMEVSSAGITPQGKQDQAPNEGGYQEVLALNTTSQGKHDSTSIKGDSLEVSMKAPIAGSCVDALASDATQDRHDAPPIAGGNLEVSSQETTPEQDAVPNEANNLEFPAQLETGTTSDT